LSLFFKFYRFTGGCTLLPLIFFAYPFFLPAFFFFSLGLEEGNMFFTFFISAGGRDLSSKPHPLIGSWRRPLFSDFLALRKSDDFPPFPLSIHRGPAGCSFPSICTFFAPPLRCYLRSGFPFFPLPPPFFFKPPSFFPG